VKTERVVLVTTPEFKAFLAREARREGVSVSEFVRVRCGRAAAAESRELASLLPELRRSLNAAAESLRRGIDDATATLRSLRASRDPPQP
jgi:hypothetical protein